MANITITETSPVISVNTTSDVVTVTNSTSNILVSNVAVASNTQVRSALSVTDAGGDGSLAYNNTSGVFTYTGPSAAEVRSHFSATSPITLSSGAIGINSNALFTGKTTDDLAEGSSNLYFTNARADARVDAGFSAKSTSDLSEGTNLYYTDARSRAAISATSPLSYNSSTGVLSISEVGDISEVIAGAGLTGGGSSGAVTLDAVGGYGITVNANDIELTNAEVQAQANIAIGNNTTDNLSEGSTNLYFSNARANAAFVDSLDNITTAISSNANITTTANIQGAVIKGTSIAISGDSSITGNLNVTGNINSETVTDLFVEDRNITLQFGQTGTPSANSQLFVDRGSSSNTYIKWDETGDAWKFSNNGSTEYKIAASTSDLAEGTNLYFTAARSRGNISVTSASPSGNGSLAYDSGTGVITFTPADVPNNTDELSEGSTNQYFTTARANTAIGAYTGALTNLTGNITTTANVSGANFLGNVVGNVTGAPSSLAGLDTGDLAEGTNLYYTDARFDTRLASKSTSNLTEGTNLYYTTARANSAIAAYTGNLTAVNTTGNITTTANISGGNVIVGPTVIGYDGSSYTNITGLRNLTATGNIQTTAQFESGSGGGLNFYANSTADTGNVTFDKAIGAFGNKSRLIDFNTTGYGVASADFHTSAPVGTNVPGLLVNLTITSGSPDVTINTMHASGLYAIGQTATGYNSYGGFAQANFTNAVAALNAALSASMQTKGWSLYNATSFAVDTNFPIGTFVTGVSGATMTMSQNATASGTAQSYLLFPGAYSTTQDLGFVVSNTGAGTLPFSHIAVNNYVASLPETLSNVTLDAVSHATSVNLANVVTRHTADLTVGALSAVRINQALLIGANATPDIASVGVGSPTPSDASILGLTLEADGVTTYPTANATPQTKFLINQYTDNSVKALAAVPSWASSFASGNATLDNNQLGAPAFNFKLLNGNKDDRANLEVLGKSVVGKIQWNAVSDGTATGFISGIDTIYPPASITVMMQDDVAQTSNVSAMDYYLGTTYPTSYRNGANVDGGGIPRTFVANKEGNTVIAAKTDGKVTLRPVRDYGDTGTDTSFVQNRYPNELHEYHEFLGAGFLSSKAGTLVEIQPKSGETGGSANFNYDSKGDATLRLSSHHANNTVKAQWDITNDESESTLIVRDHTNSATKLEFSALRTEFSTSAKLKNYNTTEINALSSPEAGDLVFNTTLNLICVYNGSAWRKINDAAM